MRSKPIVLFFARSYRAVFFPQLTSYQYESIFVTLTKKEKKRVERLGGQVVGCFEEEYDKLKAHDINENYLISSFMSDRFLGRFPYVKRLEILGKEITFWASIFETYAPIAIVNELVAIEISEVLLIECRRRQIKYLAAMNCFENDYFYWLSNPISLSGKYLSKSIFQQHSLEIAKQYIQEISLVDYSPIYVKNLRNRLSVSSFSISFFKLIIWKLRRLKDSFTGRFRYEMYVDEYGKKVAVYLKNLYISYDKMRNLPPDKEAIFFPLHQEPEATLNYMSEFYSNQVSTIENILKCLTVNQFLVVKEHPVDKGSLLQKKFWEIKKQYSGLYYIPAEVHCREVMQVAKRIVTLTSTVGWEGIITGKPVYVLGEIFYDNLVGLNQIKNFVQLRDALHNEPDKKRVNIDYLTSFVAGIIEGAYLGNPFLHKNLYSNSNKEKLKCAILDALM